MNPILLLFVALTLLLADSANAESPNGEICDEQAGEECFINNATALLDAGNAKASIALLKIGRLRLPDSRPIAFLLAKSYLRDENDFWALKTLNAVLEKTPNDCEASIWFGYIYLREGALAQAEEYLTSAQCPPNGPLATKASLLKAMILTHTDKKEAASEELEKAESESTAFAEDLPSLTNLLQADSNYITPLSTRIGFAGGWATNALAGSPADLSGNSNNAKSIFTDASFNLRFVPPFNFYLHPMLETDDRVLHYFDSSSKDYSYFQLSGRPGFLIRTGASELLFAYRAESLLTTGGDKYSDDPVWFYNAHRGEFEYNTSSVKLFGGVGKRYFRDMGRERLEFDGGLGGGIPISDKINLLIGLSLRFQNANLASYDEFGATYFSSLDYSLPDNWILRTTLVASSDIYYDSRGYFDPLSPETKRKDLLIKASPSVWTPQWHNLKLGIIYEFANRFSSTDPYDYNDHRVMLKLVWSSLFDPWLPSSVSPENHIPLEFGTAQGKDEFQSRIEELLRQNEAMQRGSTCVER